MSAPGSGLDADRVLGSAFGNAPIGMAVLDPSGVILMCNPAVCALLGRSADELVGDTFFTVTHADDMDAARRNCELMGDGEPRIVRHECRFLRRDGTVVWVSVSTSLVPAAGAAPAHLVMHIEDIDDRKALEAELRHRASHDPLTGLGNRALLLERIERAAQRPCWLFYLDLDRFKTVNDRFGHRAGDAVLCEFADRIRAVVEDGDTAVRIGGDEFVVLRPDGPREAAVAFSASLHRAVGQPFTIGKEEVVLTAAIGLCRSRPDAGATPEDVLDRADRHMYRAKSRAR